MSDARRDADAPYGVPAPLLSCSLSHSCLLFADSQVWLRAEPRQPLAVTSVAEDVLRTRVIELPLFGLRSRGRGVAPLVIDSNAIGVTLVSGAAPHLIAHRRLRGRPRSCGRGNASGTKGAARDNVPAAREEVTCDTCGAVYV